MRNSAAGSPGISRSCSCERGSETGFRLFFPSGNTYVWLSLGGSPWKTGVPLRNTKPIFWILFGSFHMRETAGTPFLTAKDEKRSWYFSLMSVDPCLLRDCLDPSRPWILLRLLDPVSVCVRSLALIPFRETLLGTYFCLDPPWDSFLFFLRYSSVNLWMGSIFSILICTFENKHLQMTIRINWEIRNTIFLKPGFDRLQRVTFSPLAFSPLLTFLFYYFCCNQVHLILEHNSVCKTLGWGHTTASFASLKI